MTGMTSMGLYGFVFQKFTLFDTLGLALGQALAGCTTLPVGREDSLQKAEGALTKAPETSQADPSCLPPRSGSSVISTW